MHWVWKHSQSKGNTRLALLYVADQVRTIAAEARVGQRELMEAMNTTSKDTAQEAVRRAIELGELEVLLPSSGRRPALYRLSKAAGYVRPLSGSAPDSGAQGTASAPESGAQAETVPSSSAPDSGAQAKSCAPVSGASAPKTGAPPHTQKEQASAPASQPDGFQICQPLIQAMTEAGITVSWSMQTKDWLEISNIVQRAGVPAMVGFALNTKATTRDPIRYATFFLRGGWRGLPPAAAAPLPPRADSKPPHCGDPDCDPVTRTRETEDGKGIRSLSLCPVCHPKAKGHAA